MDPRWKRFLAVEFPVASLVVLVAAQLLAFLLRDVAPRGQFDDLPLAIERGHNDPIDQILLFGDSTTQRATRVFNVGHRPAVLNLATDAHVGLMGDLLLARRYVEAHGPPRYIVLSLNPTLYSTVSDVRVYRQRLWNVYTMRDEHALLAKVYPGIADRDWLPAAFNPQERIFTPLLSLLNRSPPAYAQIGADPPRDLPKEPGSLNEASAQTLEGIRQAPMSLTPQAREAVRGLCELAHDRGIDLRLVWPPSHKIVAAARRATGALGSLEAQIRAVSADCAPIEFFDTNTRAAYPDFDHVGAHLRGVGWQAQFANDLHGYLAGLAPRAANR